MQEVFVITGFESILAEKASKGNHLDISGQVRGVPREQLAIVPAGLYDLDKRSVAAANFVIYVSGIILFARFLHWLFGI